MRLVLGQQFGQVLTACRPARVAVVVHHPATGKSLVDLRVQVVAIGQHQEGEVAAELAVHLAGEQHHGIALARPLRVPEHPQPAGPVLPVANRGHGPVDAQELVVPRQDLLRLAGGFVEQDEVLHQVEQVGPVAHALEQGFHGDHARLFLGQPFPLVEMLEPAGDRADPGLHTIGQHHQPVVVEQVRDRVLVVEEVLLVSGANILADVLQLHEQQRQAVDKADDVRPAAVQITAHPQLAHAEEIIVFRAIEIEHPQPLAHPLALGGAEGDLHPVPDQPVLVAVGGGQ